VNGIVSERFDDCGDDYSICIDLVKLCCTETQLNPLPTEIVSLKKERKKERKKEKQLT